MESALKNIQRENITVIMNKCMETDEPEDIQEFYREAKEQAQANELPELEADNFLLIQSKPLIKRKMQGKELMEAQMKLHAEIKDEVVQFVMNKLAATNNKMKSEKTSFEEIHNKIADDELLQILEQGK